MWFLFLLWYSCYRAVTHCTGIKFQQFTGAASELNWKMHSVCRHSGGTTWWITKIGISWQSLLTGFYPVADILTTQKVVELIVLWLKKELRREIQNLQMFLFPCTCKRAARSGCACVIVGFSKLQGTFCQDAFVLNTFTEAMLMQLMPLLNPTMTVPPTVTLKAQSTATILMAIII